MTITVTTPTYYVYAGLPNAITHLSNSIWAWGLRTIAQQQVLEVCGGLPFQVELGLRIWGEGCSIWDGLGFGRFIGHTFGKGGWASAT